MLECGALQIVSLYIFLRARQKRGQSRAHKAIKARDDCSTAARPLTPAAAVPASPANQLGRKIENWSLFEPKCIRCWLFSIRTAQSCPKLVEPLSPSYATPMQMLKRDISGYSDTWNIREALKSENFPSRGPHFIILVTLLQLIV